jgi:hypothetical protein
MKGDLHDCGRNLQKIFSSKETAPVHLAQAKELQATLVEKQLR